MRFNLTSSMSCATARCRAAVLVALVAAASVGVRAQQPAPAVERLNLTAGRSMVLMTEFDITRIAVTDPAIADDQPDHLGLRPAPSV
jgi:Flp pilus assembly secretin CpaC